MIVTVNSSAASVSKVYTFTELAALDPAACPVGSVVHAQILAGGAPFPFYTTGAAWKLCPGEYALYADMTSVAVAAGGTSEVKFTGYKLPAGLMAKVRAVKTLILAQNQYTTTGNVLRLRLHTENALAGTIFTGPTHSVNGSVQNEVILYNAGANSQLGYATSVSSCFGNSSGAVVTSALADAADSYLVTSLQPGNAAGYGTQRAVFITLIGG